MKWLLILAFSGGMTVDNPFPTEKACLEAGSKLELASEDQMYKSEHPPQDKPFAFMCVRGKIGK